jgi:hypothetical protein
MPPIAGVGATTGTVATGPAACPSGAAGVVSVPPSEVVVLLVSVWSAVGVDGVLVVSAGVVGVVLVGGSVCVGVSTPPGVVSARASGGVPVVPAVV